MIQPTKLTANDFDAICYKQILALIKRCRASGSFDQGANVVWPDGSEECLALNRLLWRKHTHPDKPSK